MFTAVAFVSTPVGFVAIPDAMGSGCLGNHHHPDWDASYSKAKIVVHLFPSGIALGDIPMTH